MKISVGVTGSIAAYRSPDFVKELMAQGHTIRVVLTQAAAELVSARVLETVSGHPVLSSDPFGPGHSSTDHIELARWADRFVIYAASADFIGRYANGLAGDFLTLQLLATRAPVWVAPAMNPAMWEHPAVQENVRRLRDRGVRFVGPIEGRVACGESGMGHIAEIPEIVAAVCAPVAAGSTSAGGGPLSERDLPLSGKRVLISAGPMRTAIDPVRFVQNRSSGRMGVEVARAAAALGARVHALLGPVTDGIAAEMESVAEQVERYAGPGDYSEKLERAFASSDVFLSLAAVLDFELEPSSKKIERQELAELRELNRPIHSVPDLVARMAERKRPDQTVIAFAAESGTDAEVTARAQEKMRKKQVDALVANPVRPGLGPEAERNELWVFYADGRPSRHFAPAPKALLAAPLVRALLVD